MQFGTLAKGSAFVDQTGPCRVRQEKETTLMNWDRIEGSWKEVKGKAKQQWGKLTDDDLDVINGRREELEGVIQNRYGYAKDQARNEVDSWIRGL